VLIKGTGANSGLNLLDAQEAFLEAVPILITLISRLILSPTNAADRV